MSYIYCVLGQLQSIVPGSSTSPGPTNGFYQIKEPIKQINPCVCIPLHRPGPLIVNYQRAVELATKHDMKTCQHLSLLLHFLILKICRCTTIEVVVAGWSMDAIPWFTSSLVLTFYMIYSWSIVGPDINVIPPQKN